MPFSSQRPAIEQRTFHSESIDSFVAETRSQITDRELGWLFENCYPNTLDTTVQHTNAGDRPDTFIITGDINAMWLRDSTAQVWPYLRHASRDPALARMLTGVLHRQTRCILIDPYANAFNRDLIPSPEWDSDHTEMHPGVFERKYELDSLCAFLRLSHGLHEATSETSCFDKDWLAAFDLALATIRLGQQSLTASQEPPYRFKRLTTSPASTLWLDGAGTPALACGLSRSPFRPSDDASLLPFPIAANAMAVVSLRKVAVLLEVILQDFTRADSARALATEINDGILTHGIIDHPRAGRIYAYEVDGYGSSVFLDDANVPSLLSLPYLGYTSVDSSLYRATRRAVLSEINPYYFHGSIAAGVGGPHQGLGLIWPIALSMQILTSENEEEVVRCLAMLKTSHAGTGFMHESFWMDDPARFTRPWFAWANTLFGETIIHIMERWPGLIDQRNKS